MKKYFIISLVIFITLSLVYGRYTWAQEQGPPQGQTEDNCWDGPPCGPPCGPPDSHGQDDHFGPPPQGKHNDKDRPELTKEDENKALAFIKEYFPTCYNHISELKEKDSIFYKKVIADKFGVMMHLQGMKNKDPEFFNLIVKKIDLEDKSMELSKQYRDTKDENEKSKIEKEMTSTLEQLFDIKCKEGKMKADKMEKALSHMRQTITEREKNKAKIVQNRLDELTGKSEYTKW